MSAPGTRTPGEIDDPLPVPLLLRHRRLVALLVLGITALAPVSPPRLQVDTNPKNMLPADDPARVRTAGSGQPSARAASGRRAGLPPGRDTRLARRDPRSAGRRRGTARRRRRRRAGPAPSQPLSTTTQVRAAMDAIAAHPVLGGQLASSDGSLVTILVPLTDDADASGLADEIRLMVAADPRLSGMRLALGGVPHAQEAFGAQMFEQLAVFAPLAALVIMALVWWHFRRARPVVAAMTLSMVTVLWTMGRLGSTGHTVHIMTPSSRFPAADRGPDSIHVISEYDERVGETSRCDAITRVYEGLARPLTLTTLTTAVGFGSLAFNTDPAGADLRHLRRRGGGDRLGVGTDGAAPGAASGYAPPGDAFGSQRFAQRPPRAAHRRHGGAAAARRHRAGRRGRRARAAGRHPVEVNDNPVQLVPYRPSGALEDAELLDRALAGTATLDLGARG